MYALVYWLIHAVVGLLGFVLLPISFRAAVTVFYVLAVELIGLIGMALPGVADVLITLELFGGFGLVIGLPLSLGRGALAWWVLPTLAAAVFIVLRLTLLFGQDWHTFLVGGLQIFIAALALAAGMLCGRSLVTLCTPGRRQIK